MSVISLNKENFSEIVEGEGVALVDFFAPWCGPCRMLAPIIEEISAENDTDAKICRINTDEEGELSTRFGIMSVPTLILFKNGKPLSTLVGLRTKKEIKSFIKSAEK